MLDVARLACNLPNMTQHAERVASSIRAELARHNVSQAKVANVLDISQQAVSRRLSGTVPFRVDELIKIADLLGLPVAALTEDRTEAASA